MKIKFHSGNHLNPTVTEEMEAGFFSKTLEAKYDLTQRKNKREL
jgi:hypothetical protein